MLHPGPLTGSPSKPPSPKVPPYTEEPASQVILSETTTTRTEIFTTTTTHFFSLPLWRKRGQPQRPHTSYERKVSHSNLSEDVNDPAGRRLPRMRSFTIGKDPPPSPHEPAAISHQFKVDRSNALNPTSSTSNRSRPSLQSLSDRPKASFQRATTLAQATLGLATPVVPSVSSSSGVNSVAFSTVDDETIVDSPVSAVRRSKSSLRLKSKILPTGDKLDDDDRRRSRGLSFGPTSLFPFSSDDKGKTKDGFTEPNMRNPTKSLTRRSSFWNRKKSTVSESDKKKAQSSQLSPSLPSAQPISPLYVGLEFLPQTLPSRPGTHARGLSRSLSEKTTTSRLGTHKPATPRPQTAKLAPQAEHPPIPPTSSTVPPPSPSVVRPRSQTNPPLLSRLSMNVLSSNTFLLPSTKYKEIPPSSARISTEKVTTTFKLPEQGDSPALYLSRLMSAVSKAEIAGVLASKSDSFHTQALQAYLERFDFIHDALDIALRKLLMHVGLPKETQQIDRVMEAFAQRYLMCNPNLFASDDHPYILAFSLIMLHTDAFNKSNKRKMTKADYIKNTRLPGVSPEVLDCFYDNIVFAPFIFIEDPVDVNGQRGLLASEGNSSRNVSPVSSPVGQMNNILGKGNKLDPYHLITNNMLDTLRVNVQFHVPMENPYSYEGTAGSWDYPVLHRAFARASVVKVGYPEQATANQLFSLSGAVPPTLSTTLPDPASLAPRDVLPLRLTKVGVVYRKDDFLEGGKRAPNRKWRPYTLLLTGSQLLFFRDPGWAGIVLEYVTNSKGPSLPLPFRPDELVSLKDTIAVFDASYTKHYFTLRFVAQGGRQILLRLHNEQELNEWIARINYASAFKTAGIRMRPIGMTGKDVQLTGIAAATSYLHDLQLKTLSKSHPKGHKWDRDAPQDLMGMLLDPMAASPIAEAPELAIPEAPEVDGADQFKTTFDHVKADLLTRWSLTEDGQLNPERHSVMNNESRAPRSRTEEPAIPTRIHILQSKIQDLDSRIAVTQTQLNSDLRLLRNFQTLTPFQRATRERVITAVQTVAKRLSQVRLDIGRLACHREVLSKDLEVESQNWQITRELALKAALDTLRSRLSPSAQSIPRPFPIRRRDTNISDKTGWEDEFRSSTEDESSICESFHSALDFSDEWPSFEAPLSFEASFNDNNVESLNSVAFPGDLSTRTSFDSHPHERYYTTSQDVPEQAEEWNRTQCAQRVSLVRLPSNIHLSTQFASHRTDRSG